MSYLLNLLIIYAGLIDSISLSYAIIKIIFFYQKNDILLNYIFFLNILAILKIFINKINFKFNYT